MDCRRGMTEVAVTVPDAVYEGAEFCVDFEGETMVVVCPNGCGPGDVINVMFEPAVTENIVAEPDSDLPHIHPLRREFMPRRVCSVRAPGCHVHGTSFHCDECDFHCCQACWDEHRQQKLHCHRVRVDVRPTHVCDVCQRTSTAFHCADGCDFDVCRECWDPVPTWSVSGWLGSLALSGTISAALQPPAGSDALSFLRSLSSAQLEDRLAAAGLSGLAPAIRTGVQKLQRQAR